MTASKRTTPGADDAGPSGTKRAPAKRKRHHKRRGRQHEEYVGYLVRVTGWDYHYSFRVSDPRSRWDSGPYSELATLSLAGNVIRPQDSKYKRANITLSARTGMMDENRAEPPRSIGSLSANAEELSAYVFVPAERLAELASNSGRVQIVHFGATRLRYRSAMIHSVSLDTHFDEEEW
jgi:hypothetical protein